ncbi:MAG: hypothetical protein A3G87_09285 [Omnitrophica bacterium RIFCSPLOWO2_12_FULL_50_11]|nr:MAG: hypothetical protein A3G87_09285 [Omnitrophica bacterium RIFCSPLOWO2_12_FULL_50_11]
MPIRTRITEVARERGWTAARVARHLGLYRSNLSAMDAGRRSVSLQALNRIAECLGVSPSDLIEATPTAEETSSAYSSWLKHRIQERESNVPDGTKRDWVHRALLAWQRHYRKRRRSS